MSTNADAPKFERSETQDEMRVGQALKMHKGRLNLLTSDELRIRRNQLIRTNANAEGWGAACGARQEEIEEIDQIFAKRGDLLSVKMGDLVNERGEKELSREIPAYDGDALHVPPHVQATFDRVNKSLAEERAAHDEINHPSHYTSHPTGIECITIIEHFPANIANAIKYLWRCGLKESTTPDKDLRKAAWYAIREADRRVKFDIK